MTLSPDWVVGFVDGEGCFFIGINEHPEMTTGYEVLPEFRVVQHERDIQLLYGLKEFFKCGVVRKNHENRFELRIRKAECLMHVADFFEKHPLKTKKNVDFKKFARIVRWMNEGKHLQTEGLIEIVELAMQMDREDKIQAREILRRLRTR
jgi:LAGLIDADG endonuclease